MTPVTLNSCGTTGGDPREKPHISGQYRGFRLLTLNRWLNVEIGYWHVNKLLSGLAIGEWAAQEVAVSLVDERRQLGAARWLHQEAASGMRTPGAGGRRIRRRRVRWRGAGFFLLEEAGGRCSREFAREGMPRLIGCTGSVEFDQETRVHHRDLIAPLFEQRQVVGDQQEREPMLLLGAAQQAQQAQPALGVLRAACQIPVRQQGFVSVRRLLQQLLRSSSQIGPFDAQLVHQVRILDDQHHQQRQFSISRHIRPQTSGAPQLQSGTQRAFDP